jgi:hypothetical protein
MGARSMTMARTRKIRGRLAEGRGGPGLSVARIVRESGDPKGFDARKWVAHWIEGLKCLSRHSAVNGPVS